MKPTRSSHEYVIRVLPIGEIEAEFLRRLMKGLEETFEGVQTRLETPLDLQANWCNPDRSQYQSTRILESLSRLARHIGVDKLLGVTEVDLYVPSLNFVFGEAECPGDVAVISIFRLDPKFYGQGNGALVFRRALKEAVHELGHTFGLVHCRNSSCVMSFSNSIYDTDRKRERFCNRCSELVMRSIGRE